jgi:poly(3-hydroxybutyrate) depolymerase
VNNLATNKSFEWFENNVIYRVPPNFPGAGRRVYPGFLQHTGFVAMNPDRHATSHYDYFKDLIKGDDASAEAHRKFYDEYNAVLDMDADYYLETINTVFQEFKLVNGTWDVLGVDGKLERVRPQDIKTTALMTVEGELDDISGSGQTRAAQDMCSGIPKANRHHLEVEGAGHYGIFSGRRWRDVVYPQVVAFIKAHAKPQITRATAKVAAPVKAAPKASPAKKAAAPQAKAKAAPARKSSGKASTTSKATAPAQRLPKSRRFFWRCTRPCRKPSARAVATPTAPPTRVPWPAVKPPSTSAPPVGKRVCNAWPASPAAPPCP